MMYVTLLDSFLNAVFRLESAFRYVILVLLIEAGRRSSPDILMEAETQKMVNAMLFREGFNGLPDTLRGRIRIQVMLHIALIATVIIWAQA